MSNRFSLEGQVTLITGGAGLLGRRHAHAVMAYGGVAVLGDLDQARAVEAAADLEAQTDGVAVGLALDVTDPPSIDSCVGEVLRRFGRINGLINNAANDPKVSGTDSAVFTRLEHFPVDQWELDLAVGLKGAFLCARRVGIHMTEAGGGVMVNIASDLALISPDQRLYRVPGLADDRQPVKPVSYSVVKHGLIGLTKYLATYYAAAGIRVNALSPGGVQRDQPDNFVADLATRIPLGRMARVDEYEGAITFLLSEASSYMTGQNLVVDGGRTLW